jgi:hypothetical protein
MSTSNALDPAPQSPLDDELRGHIHDALVAGPRDRAAVIAIVIMQLIATARAADLQRRIEQYLRDELADLAQQLAADRSDAYE